jgi:hypothetical protein
MIRRKTLALAAVAAMWGSGLAAAESWYEPEPLIWKTVRAAAGESPWDTCYRHFRNDVRAVRPGVPGTVHCHVPYHYLYGPGQSRQNFNQ